MTAEPTVVCALADLAPGTARRVEVDGVAVAVVRIGDDVYAIGDTCSHGNASLAEGEVWCDERELECPKHGSMFSLTTGEPATLPATQPVPVFVAAVVGNDVVVSSVVGSSVVGSSGVASSVVESTVVEEAR
ncbi:MAG: Rieske 2Fe-2S domain-containing protein [Ilumatobacteraceae bacterium]